MLCGARFSGTIDMRKRSRSRSQTVRRVALLCGALALLSTITLACLDAFALRSQLSDSALARTSLRLSTAPDAREKLSEESCAIGIAAGDSSVFKAQRDAALTSAATQWLGFRADAESARRSAAIRGLARWNVAPERVAPLFQSSADLELFENVERVELLTLRARTAQASHDAAIAIDELAADDPDSNTADALAFLAELGANESESPAVVGDTLLWVPDSLDGDPIDSAAFVVAGDFTRNADAVLAMRLCDASARFFFLITLGVIVCGGTSTSSRALAAALARLAAGLKREFLGAPLRRFPRSALASRRFNPLATIETVRLRN
jgi:hypothetical protein